MTIRIFDYLQTYEEIRQEILSVTDEVLRSGRLILGPQTEAFEKEFSSFVGTKHCIGVTSGTMALHLSLWAAGIGHGDEVITVANTCPPTIAAIRLCGAIPVFSDISTEDLLIDCSKIEELLTPKTRAIVCVHLWGSPAELDKLQKITKQNNLILIEDCAQSLGAYYLGKHTGTFGKAGCFSFYPTKNLGAYGDAGAIVTNDDELAEKLRLMRMYGYVRPNISEIEGMNARISELQAGYLRVKMKYLPQWLKKRKDNARRLLREIKNPSLILPKTYPEREAAFHQFVIRCKNRDELIRELEANDIAYGIHYPVPVHRMPPYRQFSQSLPVCEQAASEIISLPVHEALSEDMLDQIIQTLQKFRN